MVRYYNSLLRSIRPPSYFEAGANSKQEGKSTGTRRCRTSSEQRFIVVRSPYALVKGAVKKAKVRQNLREQHRAHEERLRQLEIYRKKSREFLLQARPTSSSLIAAEEATDALVHREVSSTETSSTTATADDSTEQSQSQQVLSTSKGKQWTTKPKLVQGKMVFTTPKRYQPQRFDSPLMTCTENKLLLLSDEHLPNFQEQHSKYDKDPEMDLEALAKAIVAAGLQEQAAALLANINRSK